MPPLAGSSSQPWTSLLNCDTIDDFISETIGQLTLQACLLPSDPPLFHSQSERRALLRLKWIFDSQQFGLRATPLGKRLPRDTTLRILMYLISVGESSSAASTSSMDYSIFRRLLLDTILSAFRLFILVGSPTTMDEEDLVMSRISNMTQRWADVPEIQGVETALLSVLIQDSMDIHELDEESPTESSVSPVRL
jgi:hypothetical protein